MKKVVIKSDELYSAMEKIIIDKRTLSGPVHQHEFFEIVLFLSEGGKHYVNGKEYLVQKGDMWLLPPGVQHCYEDEIHSNQGAGIINCICYQDIIEEFFKELLQSDFSFEAFFYIDKHALKEPLFVPASNSAEATELLYILKNELEEKKEGYLVSIRLYMKLLLLKLLRVKINMRDSKYMALSASDRLRLAQVVSYLKDNSHEKIVARDLCREFCFSESGLRNKFKKFTNKTIVEFLRDERIANACKLLEESDIAITEIGYSVGFSDKKAFYVSFEQKNGCTPKVYRDRIRSKNK